MNLLYAIGAAVGVVGLGFYALRKLSDMPRPGIAQRPPKPSPSPPPPPKK